MSSFVNDLLGFIGDLSQRVNSLFEEAGEDLLEALRIVNAVLCGFIDGLIDFVALIVKVLGLAIQALLGKTLGMDADKDASKSGKLAQMEKLEGFEDFFDLLSRNWTQFVQAARIFFAGLSWQRCKDLLAAVTEKVSRYGVAHFIGSCIFDIVLGVALAIVTGGGSAMAQATTKAEKFLELLRIVGRETVSTVTMGVYDLLVLLKNFFARLAKAVAEGSAA